MNCSIIINLILAVVFSIFAGKFALAEPWLSNRFAQNCVACHAPGRVNLPTSERRCTLSCQGCHISPNGGGLRNQYGKWNETRWLKSFNSASWRLNSPIPAALSEQKYGEENMKKFMASLAKDSAQEKVIFENGVGLKTTETLPDESNFNKTNSAYEKQIETDPRKFMYRVPNSDPLRSSREQWFQAGVDWRYFFLNTDGSTEVDGVNTPAQAKKYAAFMGLDIGVEVSPVKSLHFVFEHRYGNPPANNHWDELYNGLSKVKSAYILVDDLAYNSWVQTGLYRPLFGHSNPDHNTLFNKITGLTQFVTYNATSIGTAPNVPFLNIHLINNKTGIDDEPGMSKGTVFNLGGRFVTYGLSLMMSYWNTKAQLSTQAITRKMMAYDFGAALGKYIGNLNITRVELEIQDQASDKGTVFTLENKYRLWRENYAVFNYSYSGVTRTLKEGDATQMGLGVKSFWLSGLETELLMTTLKEKTAPTLTTVDEKNIQLQTHFFF